MKIRTMIPVIVLCCGLASAAAGDVPDWRNPDFTIMVRMYRGYPPAESFTALNEMGKILVQETAKGFIVRSIVDRDSFHPGASFCMQISPGLFNAKQVLQRTLDTIRALKPEGQFVEFNVANPSHCFKRYFQ